MRMLVSGSSGLIGGAVTQYFRDAGHDVVALVRSAEQQHPSEIVWHPLSGTINDDALEGFDVVVHLAGENIVGRWTFEKKARIRDSRVVGTQHLCKILQHLESPPKLLISASATGYYGTRGDEVLEEQHPPGAGFLSEVCRQWEQATEPASTRGIRVINMRMGMALSTHAGTLSNLIPIFRMGFGGTIGSGRQYWSWISLADIPRTIEFLIRNETILGPVNLTSPNPVTNKLFTSVLAHVLQRPAWMRIPPAVLRLTFGQLADEVLLSSARVLPSKLAKAGFTLNFPELEPAIRHLIANKL